MDCETAEYNVRKIVERMLSKMARLKWMIRHLEEDTHYVVTGLDDNYENNY